MGCAMNTHQPAFPRRGTGEAGRRARQFEALLGAARPALKLPHSTQASGAGPLAAHIWLAARAPSPVSRRVLAAADLAFAL
jgi:hypothetical protein